MEEVLNTNKTSSFEDKVIKKEYDKAKAIHTLSTWTNKVTSNHQVHAKAMVKQLARQVSQTKPRLRLAISTSKRVGNTKPPRCAKSKIIP